MKFKKGDRVEVIWRSELHQGLVEEVIELTDELTDELMVKLAKTPAIYYLFKKNQVSKVELVKVPKFVADAIGTFKEKEYDHPINKELRWIFNFEIGFCYISDKGQLYEMQLGAEGFQYRGKVHEEVFYNADDRKRATTTIK
ncbi:hypothetical protein BHW80_04555 [Listeria monocytogenes]|nr:hypothetical protein [Listeria monocytogenes]